MSIRYTPGQFRDTLGLTKETFRYWKRDLPALAASAGHSPCFGPGELLATAIVKCVHDQGGVPVRRMAALAPDLFALCREYAWPQLEKSIAVLFLKSGHVEFISLEARTPQIEATFLVPLQPVIDRLRGHLLEADVPLQRSLALPPVAVSSGARK